MGVTGDVPGINWLVLGLTFVNGYLNAHTLLLRFNIHSTLFIYIRTNQVVQFTMIEALRYETRARGGGVSEMPTANPGGPYWPSL